MAKELGCGFGSGISPRQQMLENILVAEGTLEAALGFVVDFGVEDDDRLGIRRAAFHSLSGFLNFLSRTGAVPDEGVEGFEVGAGKGAPEAAPDLGSDDGSNDFDKMFVRAALFPIADDEEEGFVDVELAERVAQADGGLELGGFGVNGDAAVAGVGFGGDVPFLSIATGLIMVEESGADPGFKIHAMALDFGRGSRIGRSGQSQAESNDEGAIHTGIVADGKSGWQG